MPNSGKSVASISENCSRFFLLIQGRSLCGAKRVGDFGDMVRILESLALPFWM